MKASVGSIDRAMRILIGLALIAATLFGAIGVSGWLGVISLVTGMFRFCPAYALFRLPTCPAKR